jgi:hypothetical protein
VIAGVTALSVLGIGAAVLAKMLGGEPASSEPAAISEPTVVEKGRGPAPQPEAPASVQTAALVTPPAPGTSAPASPPEVAPSAAPVKPAAKATPKAVSKRRPRAPAKPPTQPTAQPAPPKRPDIGF